MNVIKNKNNQKNKNTLKDEKEKNLIKNASSESLSLSNISFANPDSTKLSDEEFKKSQKLGLFVLGEKLGQGTFGFVRLATHTLTGEKVAIKILDKEKIIKEKDKFRLKNEINILKKLRHNNIVQLYSVINTQLSINLIMEYCEGEELLDYINRKQRLKEMEACIIFQQLISGIEYLSKCKITHRDLKPENIIINANNLNLKIIDFGLSNTYNKDEMLNSQCGSLCFAAPEMISGKKYNGLTVDIWSSGVILFSMICGFLPFQEEDTKLLYEKIVKGKYQVPYYVSQEAGDLIQKILNINPNKRYTIEQIKKHKWFKMPNNNNLMTEGLLVDKYIIPIDEDIIKIMITENDLNEEEIKINVIKNKHNLITTSYYLILNKKIKEGKKSNCNMTSNEFIAYLNDKNNLLENYEFNLDTICQKRISVKNKDNDINDEKLNNNNHFEKKEISKEKEEIIAKMEKIHQEIDDIKNNILMNENKPKGINKIKKMKLKKLLFNENIKENFVKVKINKTNKNNNRYFHNRTLKTHQNKKEINYKNISLKTISTIAYSKKSNNNKEILLNNDINSMIICNKNKIIKYNISSSNKKDNIKKINQKLKFNNSQKSQISNIKKELNDNNNNKNVYFKLKNNCPFSERKKSIISKRYLKVQEKRKDSCGLILPSKKKYENISSKITFNPKLINKNKNNFTYRYNKEPNTIINYFNENKKVKSILLKDKKNIVQKFIENLDEDKEFKTEIKYKKKKNNTIQIMKK